MVLKQICRTSSDKNMLRVGTKVWFPYVIETNDNGTARYSGFCIDLLNIISDTLKFRYSLVQPSDGQWGDVRDGQWTGLMGMLERQETGMTATPLSLTSERMRVSDLTMAFDQDFITVAVRKEEYTSGLWAVFLIPFTWQIYLCIMCMLLCCPSILYIITSLEHRILRHADRPSFSDIAEFLFGSLLQKAISRTSMGRARRIFVACWCLMGLFLASSYTCVLTSQMIKVTSSPPFRSLQEMIAQKNMRWGFIGGFVTLSLRNSTDPTLRKIYDGAMSFSKEDPNVLSLQTKVHLHQLLQGNYAYIEFSKTLKHMASTHCSVALLDNIKVTGLQPYAFYTQKNSTLTKSVRQVLLRLQDTGVLAYLRAKWFPPLPECKANRPRVITLVTLQGPFYVAGAGLVLGLVVLTAERCVGRWTTKESWWMKQ